MGATFNTFHVDLATAIKDVKSDGSPITAAIDDGKKRSSAQRSRDLMAGRYWAWSLFRLANSRIFHGTAPLPVTGTGVGYADVTTFNISAPEDVTLEETSVLYRQPIPVYAGEALPFYLQAMRTYKSKEIIAGLVNDNTVGQIQQMRLKVMLGVNLDQDLSHYTFLLGFYAFPYLGELTAASVTDVTEPRSWWDAVQKYAEYMALKGGADNQLAAIALEQAKSLALITIEIELGSQARSKVQQYLDAGGGR